MTICPDQNTYVYTNFPNNFSMTGLRFRPIQPIAHNPSLDVSLFWSSLYTLSHTHSTRFTQCIMINEHSECSPNDLADSRFRRKTNKKRLLSTVNELNPSIMTYECQVNMQASNVVYPYNVLYTETSINFSLRRRLNNSTVKFERDVWLFQSSAVVQSNRALRFFEWK